MTHTIHEFPFEGDLIELTFEYENCGYLDFWWTEAKFFEHHTGEVSIHLKNARNAPELVGTGLLQALEKYLGGRPALRDDLLEKCRQEKISLVAERGA